MVWVGMGREGRERAGRGCCRAQHLWSVLRGRSCNKETRPLASVHLCWTKEGPSHPSCAAGTPTLSWGPMGASVWPCLHGRPSPRGLPQSPFPPTLQVGFEGAGTGDLSEGLQEGLWRLPGLPHPRPRGRFRRGLWHPQSRGPCLLVQHQGQASRQGGSAAPHSCPCAGPAAQRPAPGREPLLAINVSKTTLALVAALSQALRATSGVTAATLSVCTADPTWTAARGPPSL